jgi:hypothetical protein
MPKPEATIQIQIFDWIRQHQEEYPILQTIFHTPNSFFGTNFAVIKHLKNMGMKKGIYDIIVPISKNHYASLWIEIKAEKGKLTQEQKNIATLINYHSDIPILFKTSSSAEESINIIKSYLLL